MVGHATYIFLDGAYYVSWIGRVTYDIYVCGYEFWLIDARVEDCRWMHCIYGGICGILGKSLSFTLIVLD